MNLSYKFFTIPIQAMEDKENEFIASHDYCAITLLMLIWIHNRAHSQKVGRKIRIGYQVVD